MIKYYHELTKEELDEICKKPEYQGDDGFNKFIKDYPQPKWCKMQDALEELGCWGLTGGRVNEKFCIGCEFCSLEKEGQ